MASTFALALVFAGGVAAAGSDAAGLLGVEYRALPEGMVVARVSPMSGAAEAGLRTGDLLVAADGVPLDGGGAEARQALTGPMGSSVRLTVRGPLGQPAREVVVKRGAVPPLLGPGVDGEALSPPAMALRRAIRRGRRRPVLRAVEALVEEGFAADGAGRAVAGPVRRLLRRDPRLAEVVADRLDPAVGDDAEALTALAEVALERGDRATFLDRSARALAARPPDVRLATGEAGDAGGAARLRADRVVALWLEERQGDATAEARALLASHERVDVRARVGMAAGPTPLAWRVPLAPEPALTMTSTRGEPWSLEAQRGHVVVLAFWATWCGPCRDELPFLAQLVDQRKDGLVELVTVSTDREASEQEVEAAAVDLGIRGEVYIAPDLGRRFDVEAIPAVRIFGRDGVLRYSGRGWAPSTPDRVREAVEGAVSDEQGGVVVAEVTPEARLGLVSWSPLAGAGHVSVAGAEVVVSVDGATPARFDPSGLPVRPPLAGGAGADGPVAWRDGPVVSAAGAPWVRALDPAGATRWLVTLPAPVVDLAVVGDRLLVATEDGVLALDARGDAVDAWPVAAEDLAVDGERVVAAAQGRVLWLRPGGVVEADGGVVGAVRVSGDGAWASSGSAGLVVGPFGPAGAPRAVVARDDGAVVALDGAGAPAAVARFDRVVHLAVAAPPDGAPRLVVSVPGRGVAFVSLALP